MQKKMVLTLLNQKSHVGITVILQEQNIIPFEGFTALKYNSCFHAYVKLEEKVWSYLILRDQYFTAVKEQINTVVNSTSNMV